LITHLERTGDEAFVVSFANLRRHDHCAQVLSERVAEQTR
jgi:hypothetical protein